MRRFSWLTMAGGLALLCACQAPPEPVPGAHVALTREAMRGAASQADGRRDAEPAIRAVGAWRGEGEEAEE